MGRYRWQNNTLADHLIWSLSSQIYYHCAISHSSLLGEIQISSSFNFHICVQSALAGLQRMEAAQDGMESGYDMQV